MTDTVPSFARSARLSWSLLCSAAVACAVVGCASWRGSDPLVENSFVSYYDKLAREAAAPNPSFFPEVPSPVMGPGRNLTAPNPDDRWSMSIAEAIRMGLANNSIIRQNAQFMSPNNPVMQSPDAVASAFDPIIQNAGVLFGQRGTDAALSDFDPRLTVTSKVSRDEMAQNSQASILPPSQTNVPPGNILTTEGVQTQARLEQQLLSGGIFGINNNWNYLQSDQPYQLFNSSWTGVLSADYRQPLWAGSGQTFTSIAGPLTQRARGFSYVNQGIVIAHINKRLSEIDLQENLQNLLREIGDLYWDLYQNYQDYDSEVRTSKLAKDLWDRAIGRKALDPGVEEAQAEDAYYESKSREETALSNLYLTEAKFRRLLGLSLDDPRLIYPSDKPREDEVSLNRAKCLYEALVNRTELCRQKINVQSLELQLIAARKLVAPKLDFVSGYGMNGFGNHFFGSTAADSFHNPNGVFLNSGALGNMFSSKETSWNLGFEYSIPLWLRQEKAQVRQLEMKIVKGRAALAAQEDEIAYELNSVLMTIKRAHSVSKITKKRLQAAGRRVIAAESDYEAGNKSNDLALRALTSQAQAQAAYSRSIAEYNKSLRDLLFRTGRLLPADGVGLVGTDGLPILPPSGIDELPGTNEPGDTGEPPEEEADPLIPPMPKKSPRVASFDGDEATDVNSFDAGATEAVEEEFEEPPVVSKAKAAELPDDPFEADESTDEITPVSGQR
jgi:outer membrane protein TolC